MLANNQTRTRHDPLYIKFPARGPSGVSVGHNTGSLAIFFFTPSPVQAFALLVVVLLRLLIVQTRATQTETSTSLLLFQCLLLAIRACERTRFRSSVYISISFFSLLRRPSLGHSNSLFSWTSPACELSSPRLPSELVMCLQVYCQGLRTLAKARSRCGHRCSRETGDGPCASVPAARKKPKNEVAKGSQPPP